MNKKYLSPLLLAYDDLVKEKEDVIKAYEVTSVATVTTRRISRYTYNLTKPIVSLDIQQEANFPSKDLGFIVFLSKVIQTIISCEGHNVGSLYFSQEKYCQHYKACVD